MNRQIEREQIQIDRQLKHSSMTICGTEVSQEDCEVKMLLHSGVPGLLKSDIVKRSGEAILEYDITGLQSLESCLEGRCIQVEEIEQLIQQSDRLLEQLESYMLSEQSVFLNPAAVFMNEEQQRYYFTYIPGYEQSFSESLRELLAYLLKKIDYEDETAVVLAYTLFQVSSREGYSMEELLRAVRKRRDWLQKKRQTAGLSAGKKQKYMEETGYSVKEEKEISTESVRTEMQEDGLIRNTKDDARYASLYTAETQDLWELEDEAEMQKQQGLEAYALGQKIKKKWKRLALIAILMLLVPLLLWFLKGEELFFRMLPVILIVETGVASVSVLDLIADKQ